MKFPEHYPEEYIRGFVEFFGKNFSVSPSVLIPRLETEVLIKRARNFIKNTSDFSEKIIVDIGSGSGIIGTSMADLSDEIFFIDISEDALKIAEKNFRTHFPDKNAIFLYSSLLKNFHENPEKKYIFLANLPYIKNEDWKNMSEDTIFEPKIALFGGEKTGFELYEKLFQEIAEKKIHGKLFIEFGFDQREIAEKILEKFPFWKKEFFADYAGIERFCEITL